MTVHPAAVIVYNAEADKYAAAEEVCVARWATSNFEHRAGEICARPATRWIGDVDLCDHHYRRVVDGMRAEAIRQHKKTQAEIASAIADAQRRREEAERLDNEKRSIVYYLYRPADDMIKIGTTTKWRDRASNHRREHGDLILLLAHAGGRKAERDMHLKFAKLRPGASEWFQPGRGLLSWIRRQRTAQQDRENNLPPQHDLKETRTLLNELDARYLKAPLPSVGRRAPKPAKPASPLAQPAARERSFLVGSERQVYCRAVDAAEYLGMTTADLKRWRESGGGPVYLQQGNTIRYRCDDLQPWAASVASETADPAA